MSNEPNKGQSVDVVVRFINGVGFPIAMCFALGWFTWDLQKTQTELLIEFKENIASNVQVLDSFDDMLSTAIEQNRKTNEVLNDLILETSSRNQRAEAIREDIQLIQRDIDGINESIGVRPQPRYNRPQPQPQPQYENERLEDDLRF